MQEVTESNRNRKDSKRTSFIEREAGDCHYNYVLNIVLIIKEGSWKAVTKQEVQEQTQL